MKCVLDTALISGPSCDRLYFEFSTKQVVELDEIVYLQHSGLVKIDHVKHNPSSNDYKVRARTLTESELTKHKEDMNNRFLQYNASLLEDGEDTFQGSFRIDESKGIVPQTRDFHEGLTTALRLMYSGVSKGGIKVLPLDQKDFEGMKDDKFKLGFNLEYSTETVKTFPYRFGVLTWKAGDTRFYKLGIRVLKSKVK